MKLIVGLGNPGKTYEKTRHNIGFMVLEHWYRAAQKTATFSDWKLHKKFKALVSKGIKEKEKIILLQPQTYMNDSGISVRAAADFYKLRPEHIFLVHDDIDLPLGTIRVQTNKNSAGHNGVESVIEHLGTKQFTRIRIGVGRDKKISPPEYVLQPFTASEKATIQQVIQEGSTLLCSLLSKQ